MKLSNLKPAKGSVRNRKRIARGSGSGRGGTSTRGHKGAKSRSGYSSKRAFEGGQMPLQMRLPKRGFKNTNRRYQSYSAVTYRPFNMNDLADIAAKYNISSIDFATLYELGIISKTTQYKVLANGELKGALDVSAHRFSGAAKKAIEAAGGNAYHLLKVSQVQGIAHAYKLDKVDAAVLSQHFSSIEEGDKIHVIAEGEVRLKFDLDVHKISAEAQKAVEAAGGKVTIVK